MTMPFRFGSFFTSTSVDDIVAPLQAMAERLHAHAEVRKRDGEHHFATVIHHNEQAAQANQDHDRAKSIASKIAALVAA